MLDIVDEHDEVIGVAERSVAHREGLRIEEGEGAGFEAWEPSRLLRALDETPDDFSSFILCDASKEIIQNIMETTR